MKYIDDPVKMQVEIIKRTFYLAVIPLSYSLLGGRMDVFLGLILGLVISTLLLRLKYLNIKRSVDMNQARAESFIRNRYFIEYIIYFAVLFVGHRNPSVDFLATAVGLFFMKITVMGWVVLDIIKNGWKNKLNSYK